MKVCAYCGGEPCEKRGGDESWTYCSECGECLEGMDCLEDLEDKEVKQMAEKFKRRNGFYYLSEDKIYPSVTTMLQIIAKPQLMSWAAKEAARAALADPTLSEQEAASIIYRKRDSAADRGKAVHSFAEMYQAGAKIDIEALPEAFRGYAKGFVSFIDGFKPDIIHRELQVWSDKYQYAGSLDMIMKIRLDGFIL